MFWKKAKTKSNTSMVYSCLGWQFRGHPHLTDVWGQAPNFVVLLTNAPVDLWVFPAPGQSLLDQEAVAWLNNGDIWRVTRDEKEDYWAWVARALSQHEKIVEWQLKRYTNTAKP